MTRRADNRRPVDFFSGGMWPEGIHHQETCADEAAAVAAAVVRRARKAIGNESIRSVAARAGMSHTTLARLLAGETWPDLVTIVQLEKALGTSLWPGSTARAADRAHDA